MFRQYWLEFCTLMLMTVLLAISFTAPGPPPVAQRTPLRGANPYRVEKPEGPWASIGWSDSRSKATWTVEIAGNGAWKAQVQGVKTSTPQQGQLTPGALENLLNRAKREEALDWRAERLRGNQTNGTPQLATLQVKMRFTNKTIDHRLEWFGKTDNYNPEQRRFLRMWAEFFTELPCPSGEKAIDYLQ